MLVGFFARWIYYNVSGGLNVNSIGQGGGGFYGQQPLSPQGKNRRPCPINI